MKTFISRIFFIISAIFFISLLAMPRIAHADVFAGVNMQDATLDPDIDYVMPTTSYVSQGHTLTIPAGTHLHFAPNAKLVVYGTLIVKGTAANHVTIDAWNYVPEKASRMAVPESVAYPAVQSPEVQTPEIAPLEVRMGIEQKSVTQGKHDGIEFFIGSDEGQISYLDIADATHGIAMVSSTAAKADHVTFTNCDTGIINSVGSMTVSYLSFVDTAFPGQIGVEGTFKHSHTTFSGKGFKGWNYAGHVMDTSSARFTPSDGEYYIFGLDVSRNGVLTIDAGTRIFIQDGFPIGVTNGTLKINGTEASPVVFYGDGTCPLDMSAISMGVGGMGETGTLSIKYARFSNLCAGVAATAGTVTVANTVFDKVHATAFRADGQAAVRMTHSEIKSAAEGLHLDNAIIKDISQNSFHDNKAGVYIKSIIPQAIVKNNYWGSDSGPKIKSNPDGIGDTLQAVELQELIYKPWLGMKDVTDTTPPSTTPDQPEEPPVSANGRNPVIIVPGITGSVLMKNYGDGSELWPNLSKLVLNLADSQLDDLALLQSGVPSTVRPVTVGDIVRKVSDVDVFAGMISTLNKNGYVEGTNLFVLPYDWRLTNAQNQSLLNDLVATALQKSGRQKVDIIAHSMGGLLVKAYVAEHDSAPIDHLFYIAVPHLGAPKTFKTLMYGDDMGFGFTVASTLRVPVLSEARVKSITQNMPSVYELLPSKKYSDILGPYIDDRSKAPSLINMEEVRKLMVAEGRNDKMFPFALALHAKTDDFDVSKISAYDFVGCGATKTITGFTLTKEQSLTLTGFRLVPEHRMQYGAGDGVVPLNSANAGNGARNYYVNAGSHGTMASLPAVQNAILSVLGGKEVALDAAVSDKTAICNMSGDVVEVHSPVSLDIYDEQGRHTGPNAEGVTEYGIPGVQYDVIENEKSAFLPSGPKYVIKNRAESAGTYDMYITHSDIADKATHQAYYSAVPLLSDKTVATVILSTDVSSPVISLDDDDNDVIDRTIQASSSLGEPQATDSVAPITTVSFDGSTVTLVATDNSSGILNTKYSVDNVIWKTYDKPFPSVPGSTIYAVSIDNAGNTEEIKELKASTLPTTGATSGGGAAATVMPSTSAVASAGTQSPAASNSSVSLHVPTGEVDDEIDTANGQSTTIADTADGAGDEDDDGTLKTIILDSRTLTKPAPDEGTVMEDPDVTLKGLSATAGAVTAVGHTGVIIVGAITLGVLIYLIFRKKRS